MGRPPIRLDKPRKKGYPRKPSKYYGDKIPKRNKRRPRIDYGNNTDSREDEVDL